MAIMSAQATAAELQRKKNNGIAPTNSANNAAYNKLKVVPNPNTGVPKPPSNSIPNPNASVIPKPSLTPPKVTVPKSSAIPNPNQSPLNAQSSEASQYADWQAKNNANYANLEKLSQAQFTYDPETDPGYQAQRQLAQLRAGDATKGAMEAANEKGIFGSSVMTSQLGQIQQRAEQEAAAYIPEYRQQAYGQFQDRLAAAGNLLNQSRNLRGDQFNEAVTEGELTGSYMSPQARTLLNGLFDLKSKAEATGITREERAALSKQADGIRAQLTGMGVDASQFGSNVNLNTARGNTGKAGIDTLAKQGQDYNQSADTRNYERGVLESDRGYERGVLESDRGFKYTQGRDQVEDARWQTEFDRIKEQDGIQNAIAWANQSLNQTEFEDSSAYKWAGLDAELSAAANQGEKYAGMSANDVVSNVRKNFEVDKKLPTDPKLREQMYMQILGANLPDDKENQALAAIGFTKKELEALDAAHVDLGK